MITDAADKRIYPDLINNSFEAASFFLKPIQNLFHNLHLTPKVITAILFNTILFFCIFNKLKVKSIQKKDALFIGRIQRVKEYSLHERKYHYLFYRGSCLRNYY